MADASASTSASFWTNDDAWSVAWPAAIAFAMLFHGFAFVASQHAPQKVKQEPIEMAIAMPPPPPPPPPEPEKPPEPEPPKPIPKVKDLPPPPNETKPVDTPPPEDVKPVTGVTADSVVADNAGGPQVRVGNTTMGDPEKEKFTPPAEVQKVAAVPFDLRGYRDAVFKQMNKMKRYPRKARVLGLEGQCLVSLLVNKDGSLAAEPTLFKGSGHDVLDAECLRMAKEAAPYPTVVGDTEFPVRIKQPVQFSVLEADRN